MVNAFDQFSAGARARSARARAAALFISMLISARVGIQRAAEQEQEAQDVVDLVWDNQGAVAMTYLREPMAEAASSARIAGLGLAMARIAGKSAIARTSSAPNAPGSRSPMNT